MNFSINFLIIIIIIVSFMWKTSSGQLIILDIKKSLMVEFAPNSTSCYFTWNRDHIKRTLQNANHNNIKFDEYDEIKKFKSICMKRQMENSNQGGFIYPGTRWCGSGSVATNYSDLGNHRREDMCCREHDHCPNSLERGTCKQGICNNSLFTRSHCDCDEEFRRCLQNVHSETANTIGALFFNVLQIICFRQIKPCAEFQSSESKNLTENKPNSNCPIEFHLAEKYMPSEVMFHYRTKGEVLEAQLNKFLRKINYL